MTQSPASSYLMSCLSVVVPLAWSTLPKLSSLTLLLVHMPMAYPLPHCNGQRVSDKVALYHLFSIISFLWPSLLGCVAFPPLASPWTLYVTYPPYMLMITLFTFLFCHPVQNLNSPLLQPLLKMPPTKLLILGKVTHKPIITPLPRHLPFPHLQVSHQLTHSCLWEFHDRWTIPLPPLLLLTPILPDKASTPPSFLLLLSSHPPPPGPR